MVSEGAVHLCVFVVWVRAWGWSKARNALQRWGWQSTTITGTTLTTKKGRRRGMDCTLHSPVPLSCPPVPFSFIGRTKTNGPRSNQYRVIAMRCLPIQFSPLFCSPSPIPPRHSVRAFFLNIRLNSIAWRPSSLFATTLTLPFSSHRSLFLIIARRLTLLLPQ